MTYLIKNGRLVDPAADIDEISDVLVSEGKIAAIDKNLSAKADATIDAKGKIIAPGLVDMHAHLREPGREDEETILTGTRSALRGGYTSVACMPNTEPVLDNVETIKRLKAIVKKDALVKVFIIGAITQARAGKVLTDFEDLKKEGVVAISDDGSSVDDSQILLEALKEAKTNSLVLIEHCEDKLISAGGMINQGFVATKTGLRGIPARAESERIARDIELAKKAASKIHIAHVSCKESVEVIRKAKGSGIAITAETCPHYFTLTDECTVTYDTNTKMNPPLRTREDIEALKTALRDGTIDVIATDHAPHTDSEKDVEFDFAPFGIVGLETALSLAVSELVEKKVISWKELISKMSTNPAKILGLENGGLRKGSAADIIIINPSKEYVYRRDSIESKSKNSPFIDWKLKAKVTHVFVSGKLVMKDEVIYADEVHSDA